VRIHMYHASISSAGILLFLLRMFSIPCRNCFHNLRRIFPNIDMSTIRGDSASMASVSSETPSATIVEKAKPKTTWQRLFPVMACGAGLFSDGYINNVSRTLPYSSHLELISSRSLAQYQQFSPENMASYTRTRVRVRTCLP